MPYVNYHPVFLNLNDRRVLIVGGGFAAVEKLESLLPESGARIDVISPEARPEIQQWHAEGKLNWIPREFVPDDVRESFLVIAATNDPELNKLVFETGNAANRLSNSVDDPENCNFIMAALIRRGPLQVAVSSAGASPALAQRVRNRVKSEILTDELGKLCEFVGDRRERVKAALTGFKVKQAFWEGVLESDLPRILLEDGEEAAARYFESHLAAILESGTTWSGMRRGKAWIVGAGPGDPELITLKAICALQRANVVLYDRLANPALLGHAPAKAKRVYVGKEVGVGNDRVQLDIHRAMVAIARAGLQVVRLKGGDPFVFGRGGEEALVLRDAGIDFEVVPGISSSIAGPAAAGIPVTHRSLAAGFAVFTGHEAEGNDEVPWAAAAQMPTAVFLMGVKALPRIVAKLLENGKDPSTPVAVVSNATLPHQQSAFGSLATIAPDAAHLPSPAVIVVGAVVNVGQALASIVEEAQAVA